MIEAEMMVFYCEVCTCPRKTVVMLYTAFLSHFIDSVNQFFFFFLK